MSLLKLYLEKLQYLHGLQVRLAPLVEQIVTLKPVNKFGCSFVPTQSLVSEQIKQWPENIPVLLPLPLWIEPRRGKVELEGQEWEFAFHGTQGLSFFHAPTQREVSIEYSTQGDIGVTRWTVKVFLENLDPNEPHFQDLLRRHEEFFGELGRTGYLIKIPPRVAFIEDVFRLQET